MHILKLERNRSLLEIERIYRAWRICQLTASYVGARENLEANRKVGKLYTTYWHCKQERPKSETIGTAAMVAFSRIKMHQRTAKVFQYQWDLSKWKLEEALVCCALHRFLMGSCNIAQFRNLCLSCYRACCENSSQWWNCVIRDDSSQVFVSEERSTLSSSNTSPTRLSRSF